MTVIEAIKTILAQYGNLESSIPVNHPYWDIKLKLRTTPLATITYSYTPGPIYLADAPVQHQDTVKMNLVRIKIDQLLVAADGKQGNVPYPGDYWFLSNLYRFYLRQPV